MSNQKSDNGLIIALVIILAIILLGGFGMMPYGGMMMYNYGGFGMMGLFYPIIMILFAVVVVFLIVWLIKNFGGNNDKR